MASNPRDASDSDMAAVPFRARLPSAVRHALASSAAPTTPGTAPPPPDLDAAPPALHPFTHTEHGVQQERATHPLARAWAAASTWYWPANAAEAHAAEQRLLARAGTSDAWQVRTGFVDVGPDPMAHEHGRSSTDQQQHRLINTVIIEPKTPPAQPKAPVVLLHGYGAGVGMWYRSIRPLADALVAEGHTLYALDWLGMARSARMPYPTGKAAARVEDALARSRTEGGQGDAARVDTLTGMQRDAPKGVRAGEHYFLDALSAWQAKVLGAESKPHVIAHSLGGYLAATYAMRHPDAVKHLVLVSPVGLPVPPDDAQRAATGAQNMHRGASAAAADGSDAAASPDASPVEAGGSGNPPSALPLHWRAARAAFTKLWDAGYTPMSLMRSGPWGAKLASLYTRARFPVPADELADIESYLFHANAHAGAAGELALSTILAPGAWARDALGPRIARAWLGAQDVAGVPTRFVYGDVDWMDWRHAARAMLAVPAAARARGGAKHVSVHMVEGAGHQVMLDAPENFARVVVDAVNACEAGSEPRVGKVDEATMVEVLAESEQQPPAGGRRRGVR